MTILGSVRSALADAAVRRQCACVAACEAPAVALPATFGELGWGSWHDAPLAGRGPPDRLTDWELLNSLTFSGVDAIGSPWVRLSLTKGMIAADFLADPPGTGLD